MDVWMEGVPGVGGEFDLAELGDVRRNRRLQMVLPRLCTNPRLGFPQALGSEAETEGFYRLLRSRGVEYGALVQAHADKTVKRMGDGATVLVIHDTTEFKFSGEGASRKGLGRTNSAQSGQGFFAHVSLAMSEMGEPLGALALHAWARTGPGRGHRKLSGKMLSQTKDRESKRWWDQIEQCEQLVGPRAKLLHIADREADAYPLLTHLTEGGHAFVIRMAQDRRAARIDESGDVDDLESRISELLHELPIIVQRDVQVAARPAKTLARKLKTKDAREGRLARLAIRSGPVALKRPRYCEGLPETLELNVVFVEELDAPEGEVPISWVLLTSESVATPAEVEAIVDQYRARWTIEEFFKAIKTGCAFEERQLESFGTLTNALALFVPIAWQMLLLRWKSRANPDDPAETVLDAVEIAVLQHFQPKKMPQKSPTVRDALFAVAGLGGHLKNNGWPGWLTLSRGFETLLIHAAGWRAALASTKTDRRSS
jgi:hypothetical protein